MKTNSVQDLAGRELISDALTKILFVRAGAGTGKTTALVNRIVNLIESGALDITRIAAITFTDRAANELRVRVRMGLQNRIESGSGSLTVLKRALELLPSAMIGTIHSFSTSLLQDFGTVVGLPLVFKVVSDLEDRLLFDREWDRYSNLLYDDADTCQVLEIVADLGIGISQIKALGRELDHASKSFEVPASVPPGGITDLLATYERQISEIANKLMNLEIGNPNYEVALGARDALALRIVQLRAAAAELFHAIVERGASGALVMLSGNSYPQFPSMKVSRLGNKANWTDAQEIALVRETILDISSELEVLNGQLKDSLASFLLAKTQTFVAWVRNVRKRSGHINFDDLLRLSLELVRCDNRSLLAEIRSRFQVILVDEFQDTDPVQIELIRTLSNCQASFSGHDSSSIAPVFFVGDPRQSIYRFRGADLDSYLGVAQEFVPGQPGSQMVDLTENFRSTSDITSWVNDVFEEVFNEVSNLSTGSIHGVRPAIPGLQGVKLLCLDASETPASNASDTRSLEASMCANAVIELLGNGTKVESNGSLRDIQLSDIAIVVPTRAILPELFKRLDANNIRFSAGNSSPIYQDDIIRELFLILTAATRRHDALSVFHALSTALLGVSTQVLFDAVVNYNYRSFDALLVAIREKRANLDEASVAQVARAVGTLEAIGDRDLAVGCFGALQFSFEILGLYERAAGSKGIDETWRRLDFILDEAKEWTQKANVSLRSYVDFVGRRIKDGERVNESEGGDLDVNALSILTIHAAKGLEFPIVILAGTSNQAGGDRKDKSVVINGSEIGVRFSSSLETVNFTQMRDLEKEKGKQEVLRLLYVATTRARDQLIITIPMPSAEIENWRGTYQTKGDFAIKSSSIWQVIAGLSATEPISISNNVAREPLAQQKIEISVIDESAWTTKRQTIIAKAMRPTTLSPTSLMESRQVSPPKTMVRQRGPDIRELGILVHACLAVIPLDDTDRALTRARSILAQRCADPSQIELALKIIAHALDAPSVKQSRSSLREFGVSITLSDGFSVLESVIDMAYQTGDTYQILDFKIVADLSDEYVSKRMEQYQVQGSLYKYGLEKLVGQGKVAQVVFLFLSPDNYKEVVCDCWSNAETQSYLTSHLAGNVSPLSS